MLSDQVVYDHREKATTVWFETVMHNKMCKVVPLVKVNFIYAESTEMRAQVKKLKRYDT